MTTREITLRSDLVERLQAIAKQQGRSIEDVVGELLNSYAPIAIGRWALAVAEGMEAASIDWIDDPDAAGNSHNDFKRHMREQWEQTQSEDSEI